MRNEDKVIIDLCGGTGSWSQYYEKEGYDVRVLTSPDFDVTNPEVKEFVVWHKPYGILAAPQCTHFSIVRNDKTARLPRDMEKGMEIVKACLEIIWGCRYKPVTKKQNNLKFWALENPRGYLVDFLGKPPLMFNPYDYGDPYTKKTCVWGNFNVPKKNPVIPRDFEHPTTKGAKDFVSCVEHFADLKTIPEGYMKHTGINKRDTLRSMTPKGFAKAFFEANK